MSIDNANKKLVPMREDHGLAQLSFFSGSKDFRALFLRLPASTQGRPEPDFAGLGLPLSLRLGGAAARLACLITKQLTK